MGMFSEKSDLDGMRLAGRLAGEALDYITPFVVPGVSTLDLDRLCREYVMGAQQAYPSSLNYAPSGYRPFPFSICASVNHEVCHGLPRDKPLRDGDIVNLDLAVTKNGYFGDNSRMFIVGKGSVLARRLCQVAFESMWIGIAEVRPGKRLGDIGAAIQKYAESQGFSVVREYCGHGIGKVYHEEPQVTHFGRPSTGELLCEGMTFTIEPMLNAKGRAVKVLPDGWTVVTKDHSLSAQWEHTVLVTEDGVEVLTLSTGAPRYDGARKVPSSTNIGAPLA